jgi:hypothetical protein
VTVPSIDLPQGVSQGPIVMKETEELPAYQKFERKQPLSEYGLSYFNELLSEYRTLSMKDADPEAKAAAEAILKKEALTWGDIYSFETTILKLQPIEHVRRRARALREKYRAMVGEQAYDVYLKSNPPDPSNSPEGELRADLAQLLNSFHWQYTVVMAGERMRGGLSKWIVSLMGLVVAGFAIAAMIIVAFDLEITTPTILIVLFMGILGGFEEPKKEDRKRQRSLQRCSHYHNWAFIRRWPRLIPCLLLFDRMYRLLRLSKSRNSEGKSAIAFLLYRVLKKGAWLQPT